MPYKPAKPCRHPGCPELTHERFCLAHKRAARRDYDSRRGSASARGYGRNWRKARLAFLAAHPMCKPHLEEKGEVVASTTVDHIIPHKGNRRLMWDQGNWQPMCDECHNRKTATEDGGFGRAVGGGGGGGVKSL